MIDETTSKEYDERGSLDSSDTNTEPVEPTRHADTGNLQSYEHESAELQSSGTGETVSPEEQKTQEETAGPTDTVSGISTSSEFYGHDQVRAKSLKAKVIEHE